MRRGLIPLISLSLVGAFCPLTNRKSISRVRLDAGVTSEAANQNVFGVLSDAVTGGAFSLLHLQDDCGIEDSSKNLRVLWVRALLDQKNMIHDDVAKTLLPKDTRWLVTTDSGAKLFDPLIKFTEWIQARTDFIDTALERFLRSPVCLDPESGAAMECNVVLFGAGYDTRALRYRHRHENKINIFEVDLPEVVDGKGRLYKKFQRENDQSWDLENKGSTLIPLNLNSCGGSSPVNLVEELRKNGLKENVPTFFVWEAVLFYIDEDAVRNIMNDLFKFAQPGGNGESPRAETLLCFTDSLKPFVDVPFTNEANTFFKKHDLTLLEHRSRWGGAVHFALASTPSKNNAISSLEKFFASEVGGLVNSYTPTQSNNPTLMENPSFDNTWYAIGYPWQIDGYETAVEAALDEGKEKKQATKPFATRLWGEPLVVYRDGSGELVALADVCPHRSAPLSMGTVEDGKLVCFYHGWKFGKKGECTDVPTLQTIEGETARKARNMAQVSKANCQNHRAIVEHEGIVWVWRGNLLEADPSLLPSKRKGDMETVPVDSVLDYNVDYSYIVENNLDSPHLFYLHDGSIPPIEDIGLMNKNLGKLRLKTFRDDCGVGHLGKLGADGRPKKLIRFDPPNIVRHGGVSGFEEEFHCIPIAPHRTRVLIRQHLPKGPILSTITSIPYVKPLITLLVNNWNYHIGLEDSAVMQGQASRIENWGAPRMLVGGLGDDLIKKYWMWRDEAHNALTEQSGGSRTSPYFTSLANNGVDSVPSGIATGTALGDDPAVVARVRKQGSNLITDDGEVNLSTGEPIGSWGIKQNFIQQTPQAVFPPINYKRYAKLLVIDDLVKILLQGESSSTMVKSKMDELGSKVQSDTLPDDSKGIQISAALGGVVAAIMVLTFTGSTNLITSGAFAAANLLP